jgi:hypothetical protein
MSMDTTTTQTETTRADPTTLAREGQMWDAASGLATSPYQGYDGQRVAGFTPDQLSGFEAARQAATAGTGTVNQAIGMTQQAGAYNPLSLDPRFAGPAAQADPAQLLAAYQAAGQSLPTAGARDVAAQDAVGGINQYLNPYTDAVVDSSLSDLERQRQMAITSGQARAAAAGAFGGSRHGVADSLTNAEAMRAGGALFSQLHAQGFNTALGAATNDANRNLQGQMANQGADVATSVANANNAYGFAGQGLSNAANLGMFNAGAQNNMAQFNAGQGSAADMANQQAGLAGNAQRLGAAGQLGGLGQTQQNMGMVGADALTRIGGMQQGLNQAQNDVRYDDWLREQADPYNKLMFQQGFLGTVGQDARGTTKEEGSALGGLIGAASTIAGGPVGGAIANMFGGGKATPAASAANFGLPTGLLDGYRPPQFNPWAQQSTTPGGPG